MFDKEKTFTNVESFVFTVEDANIKTFAERCVLQLYQVSLIFIYSVHRAPISRYKCIHEYEKFIAFTKLAIK